MRVPTPVNPHEALALGNRYYCKNPQSLRKVLTELRRYGYVVESARSTERQSPLPTDFQQRYMPMWHAKLPGVKMAQCLNCQGIIDRYDITSEDHRCEFCDELTMQPFMLPGGRRRLAPQFKYILFWRGKAYPSSQCVTGALQFPITIEVFEAWRWAQLAPGPQLAHHVLQEIGGINPDGEYDPDETLRDAHGRLRDMDLFVRDFTTVPEAEWTATVDMLKTVGQALAVRDALLVHLR